jgi:dienelactone hydrolase
MHTEHLDYADGSLTFDGYFAYEETWRTPRPCVLIAHAWHGQAEPERQLALRIAELGFVAFAIDLYGKGVRGDPAGDNTALMLPLLQDRGAIRTRMVAAVNAAKSHRLVDEDQIGAIGFCFGGLCALDLARSNIPSVRGVASFHGILQPPNVGVQAPIDTKILILHGYDDPMAPPSDVLAIAQELTAAQADWQLHAYGHAMHAFSFPGANMPERGIVYNAAAARRSWLAMKNFFAEVFS